MTSSDNELRRAGLKVTAPRIKILEILERSGDRHLSVEEVYRQLGDCGNDVALPTVYRVLSHFEEHGLVIRHNFQGGQAVFELNRGKHHDHLICLGCSSVIDFVDPEIEQRQRLIADKYQFNMTDHSLNIYGFCEHCEPARSPENADAPAATEFA